MNITVITDYDKLILGKHKHFLYTHPEYLCNIIGQFKGGNVFPLLQENYGLQPYPYFPCQVRLGQVVPGTAKSSPCKKQGKAYYHEWGYFWSYSINLTKKMKVPERVLFFVLKMYLYLTNPW